MRKYFLAVAHIHIYVSKVSKVGSPGQRRPEGSTFNSYNPEV